MRLNKVTLHNFRSFKHTSFNLMDYGLLVGENNVGKSTLIDALRIFYEEDKAKFSESRDFPKFKTEDNESWIEIEYLTTDEEQNSLKEEYCSSDNILKVRKYLKSDDSDLVKSRQSNIYAYEDGELSKNLFYGAKNISQSKLGQVIYIPEISTTSETLKLSGPSPLRGMIYFVFNKVIKNSEAYSNLNEAFETFNKNMQEEKSEGLSMDKLINDINSELDQWDVNFGFEINPIDPKQIVKRLLSHYIEDQNLDGERVNIETFGQGLQRHLIYKLIVLSSKYTEKKTGKNKEFDPDFTLILFEEPEAFLHPTQQEQINLSLREISEEKNQQVLATSHSPIFVSEDVKELNSIVRLTKSNAESSTHQLDKDGINNLWKDNVELSKYFEELLEDDDVPTCVKNKIKNDKLDKKEENLEVKLEKESIRYFLRLDNERASLFFSNKIIICEGPSEKKYFEFLINQKWKDLRKEQVYFFNAIGKFNIHRYMNLFGKLGIPHSVLMDKDNNNHYHKYLNNFIEKNENEYTDKISSFEDDLEAFLDIEKPDRRDLKPANIFMNHHNDNIDEEKIQELKSKIKSLI